MRKGANKRREIYSADNITAAKYTDLMCEINLQRRTRIDNLSIEGRIDHIEFRICDSLLVICRKIIRAVEDEI